MTLKDKIAKARELRFKLKVLFVILLDSIKGWKEFVWDVELDEQVCCSGRSTVYPCGCMGTTHREQIEWQYLGNAQEHFEDPYTDPNPMVEIDEFLKGLGEG